MNLQIVAIRDIKANYYRPPVFVQSIGGAVRAFGDACKDKTGQDDLNKHPEDFELYHVGEWSDEDCHFETEADGRQWQNKQIAVGSDYK